MFFYPEFLTTYQDRKTNSLVCFLEQVLAGKFVFKIYWHLKEKQGTIPLLKYFSFGSERVNLPAFFPSRMGGWRIPSNSGGNFIVVVASFVVVVLLVALVNNFDELVVVLIKFNFEVWRDL